MSTHRLHAGLSDYFHVTMLEPTLGWRTHLTTRCPARHWSPLAERPNFQVQSSEPWLPRFYRPRRLAAAVLRQRLERARRGLAAKGCTRFVLYVWTLDYIDAIRFEDWDLVVYQIADEYSFSPKDPPTSPAEHRMLRESGLVLIHSAALFEKNAGFARSVMRTPNGVDYQRFAEPTPEPDDLRDIPHPRIGYTGWIKSQLDWPLLDQLATRHPEWSFVFVGGLREHRGLRETVARMGEYSNVWFLGERPTEEMARYPQHFDACIMPYQLDGYTKYIQPLKLYEYLATGRPTLGTRIPAIEEAGAAVDCVEPTFEAWERSIARALLPEARSEAAAARRRSAARSFDWSLLSARIATRIALELGSAE